MTPLMSDMLRRANQALARAYDRGHPHLTLGQLQILRALGVGGELNQAGLVQATKMDKSTICAVLPGLERAGYVKRWRGGGEIGGLDRRAQVSKITPKGRATAHKCLTLLHEAEQDFLAVIPPALRAPFIDALSHIYGWNL